MYLKKAAETAKTALFFLKYGQRLLGMEKWSEAEKVFQKALNTKEIQKSIQDIQKYKRELAKEKREKMKHFFPNIYSDKDKTQKNGEFSLNQVKDFSPEKEKREKLADKKIKMPTTNQLEKIYFGMGLALYQQEKYEKALFYFKKSIEVDDTFVNGYQWIDYTERSILEKKEQKNHQKS